jgi:hypothetical protein
VAAWIMLVILGVPSPLPLALIIALLDLIPLVGATLGAVLVGVVTLFVDFPTTTIIWTVLRTTSCGRASRAARWRSTPSWWCGRAVRRGPARGGRSASVDPDRGRDPDRRARVDRIPARVEANWPEARPV